MKAWKSTIVVMNAHAGELEWGEFSMKDFYKCYFSNLNDYNYENLGVL